MNDEKNEKLNEVEEVIEAEEMTDDEAEEISGGSGIGVKRKNLKKRTINKV